MGLPIARPWLAALVLVALVHAVAALACLGWLATAATPIDGEHPALKPLRFALSIAVLLGSVALVLRGLAGADRARAAIAWTLGPRLRWAGLIAGAALWAALAVGTQVQAYAGQAPPALLRHR